MADESKNKDVLVHADYVKVYFKGKDKNPVHSTCCR